MLQGKLHFSRPPTLKELKGAVSSGAQGIFMPRNCFERLSLRARKFLDSSGIAVVIENARGRPINITAKDLLEIVELHKDNRTYREIENVTGIPKSTVHYLVKYAQRQKLKKNGEIVYL